MRTAKDLAYSYIRFSHPDQAKGDSVRRQTADVAAWCKRSKVQLDASVTLQDLGKSAFTGTHRTNPDRHALAAFLKLVEDGRIARGSYLVIENLDRLSREHIQPALLLALNLLQAGIRIVQLKPAEMIFDSSSDTLPVMMMMMELSRGHGESAMKSERVGAAWQEKKRRAAANGEALTARTPAWLRLVDGKVETIAPAAETVRLIFKLATDGHGIGRIAHKLNADGVPVVGHADHWARSYVAKLLNNRAVVGEYQPFTGRGPVRRADGKPIAGYYPPVITESEWYAARAALTNRRTKAGRLMKDHVNVFAGLLHDASDGGTLQTIDQGKKSGGRVLVSYKAIQGVEGSKRVSFPFKTFEKEVLGKLREIDPREILPSKDKGPAKALVLAGRLAEVEAEIEHVKRRLQAKYSDAVADVLERHEAERKVLTEQLNEAHQDSASPLTEAWVGCRTLCDVLEKAADQEEARVRLRAALRRILEGVWCVFVAKAQWRIAAVQVWFVGGKCRDYIIMHRPAAGGAVKARAADSWCESAAFIKPGELDLRKPQHAKRLAKVLADFDPVTMAK